MCTVKITFFDKKQALRGAWRACFAETLIKLFVFALFGFVCAKPLFIDQCKGADGGECIHDYAHDGRSFVVSDKSLFAFFKRKQDLIAAVDLPGGVAVWVNVQMQLCAGCERVDFSFDCIAAARDTDRDLFVVFKSKYYIFLSVAGIILCIRR